MNKYSLNAKSYGISKKVWYMIRDDVSSNELTSNYITDKYKLLIDEENKENEELKNKRLWFLYDKLLQEKYNHLYIRDKLINPKVGDYVYCDYEGFGRGTVVTLHSHDLMMVKFDKRPLNTMCSSSNMVTVHDDIKRKLTRV